MIDSYTNVAETKQAFETGPLARDEYWTRMQQFHLALRQYSDLIKTAHLDRIEIDAEELRIVLKNGLKFHWNPHDIRTAPNILLNHGEYEPTELLIMSNLAQSCKVIFDVGANIGWYSLHLARLLEPRDGKVYSFEPVPSTMSELTRNIELNGLGNVIKANNLALGEAEGTLEMYLPAFTGSVAASARPLFPDDVNRKVECRVTTLDAFVREHQITRLDCIKCDVEGAELFVLKGGLETIKTLKPVIMLEMLRKWARVYDYHPNDIISLMREHGYGGWSYGEDGFVEVPEVDDACTQTNFFFLHTTQHSQVHELIANAVSIQAATAQKRDEAQ